eukprot:TRINITY_DN12930_c0_g1_i1.p1 TRINITY_DN12930_c0_g1~~TRINITY_DN12930_c0_g1_i1.p1  ORF type:complete len:465 (+),score=119.91 TRINITY_DN12930_c0_g1_i1:246-1640(+)
MRWLRSPRSRHRRPGRRLLRRRRLRLRRRQAEAGRCSASAAACGTTRDGCTSGWSGMCSSVGEARGRARARGFERIVVIDDRSTDATPSILRQFAARHSGVLTVVPGPVPAHDNRTVYPPSGVFGVRDAATHAMCWDHAAPHVKWMALIDSDEFVFPRRGCSLRQHVATHCAANATHVLLRWEMFGGQQHDRHPPGFLTENFLTSGGNCSQYVSRMRPRRGVERRRSDRSCRNKFDWCGHGGWTECRHTKYIANTDCLRGPRHAMAHQPALLSEAAAGCDAQADSTAVCTRWAEDAGCAQSFPRCGAEMAPRCCSAGIGFNHYAAKSAEARGWRKRRGQRDPSPPLHLRDLNWVVSTAALRFVRRLREMLPAGRSPDVDVLSGAAGKSCHVSAGVAHRTSGVAARNDTAVDAAGCCAVCTATAGCGAFTFFPADRVCVLQELDAVVHRGPQTGATAGVVIDDEC